jgi:hypothetical protein
MALLCWPGKGLPSLRKGSGDGGEVQTDPTCVLEATGFSFSTTSITWVQFPVESDVQNNHCNL